MNLIEYIPSGCRIFSPVIEMNPNLSMFYDITCYGYISTIDIEMIMSLSLSSLKIRIMKVVILDANQGIWIMLWFYSYCFLI